MIIQGKHKKMAWVGFIALTILLLLIFRAKRQNTAIKEVVIELKKSDEQESMLTEPQVQDVIKRAFGSNLVNVQVVDLELERLEQVLEADPSISNAEVYVDAINRLQISVRQREPILRIRDNNGADYYLDSKGLKFPWSKVFTPRIIVATGYIPAFQADYETKENSRLKDLVTLTRFLHEDEFLITYIQQIYMTDKGEFILVPLVGSHKILIGDISDLEQKFKKLQTFYKEGLSYKGWKEYDVVDLRYKGQVIGRKI
jgi:cell division protein FtsQ